MLLSHFPSYIQYNTKGLEKEKNTLGKVLLLQVNYPGLIPSSTESLKYMRK